MITLNEILKTKVSFQENTWSKITNELTIEEVLNQIKSNKYKVQIEELRNKLKENDYDFYDSNKKKLAAVTFCATFNSDRKIESLKKYNKILIIDIDKLDEQKLKTTFDYLNEDSYVLSFWRSPSNKGYKGIVAIDYQINDTNINLIEQHKCAFKKLSNYFIEKYDIELDKSGSDINRLCFLSHDNFLVQKLFVKNFIIGNEDLIFSINLTENKSDKVISKSNRDALFNPFEKNIPSDRKTISNIIRYLNKNEKSITYSFYEWFRVAMAIANSFTFEIGLKYFLKLSLMDKDKFNEKNCTNFLINCYETRKLIIKFESIVYLAKLKGFKTKNLKNGVPKAEM